EHVELGLVLERAERPGVERRPQRGHKELRVLGGDHHADAPRVVRVEIEHGGRAELRERVLQRRGVRAAAERGELHEQSPVERDRLAAPHAALGEIERSGLRRGGWLDVLSAHGFLRALWEREKKEREKKGSNRYFGRP